MTHHEADVYALVVGKAIALLRENRGLSQTQLAEAAGITQSMLSRLERGQAQADSYVLRKLAEALGFSNARFGQLIDEVYARAEEAAKGAMKSRGLAPWWQNALGVAGIVGLSGLISFAASAALAEVPEKVRTGTAIILPTESDIGATISDGEGCGESIQQRASTKSK